MSEDKAHILVIDDDMRIRDLITQFLRKNGLLVSHAESAAEARSKMRAVIFDLLVLDVMMPEETGLSFIKELEKQSDRPPVLMLTALSKTEERIEGLESGADDYLPKPFDPKELLLRIQKLLGRTQGEAVLSVKMGDFVFADSILTHKGERVALPMSDINLLNLLVRNAHKIVSRQTIAAHCTLDSERAVDVRVNRLRQKIEAAPNRPVFLQTVRGEGYILKPE